MAEGSCQARSRIISGAYVIPIPIVSSSSLVDGKTYIITTAEKIATSYRYASHSTSHVQLLSEKEGLVKFKPHGSCQCQCRPLVHSKQPITHDGPRQAGF